MRVCTQRSSYHFRTWYQLANVSPMPAVKSGYSSCLQLAGSRLWAGQAGILGTTAFPSLSPIPPPSPCISSPSSLYPFHFSSPPSPHLPFPSQIQIGDLEYICQMATTLETRRQLPPRALMQLRLRDNTNDGFNND